MRSGLLLTPIILGGAALVTAMGVDRTDDAGFTADFGLEHVSALVPDGGNRWYSLRPGRFMRYEGVDEDGRFVESVHTVLDQVRAVPFEVNGRRVLAQARVVEEREWFDGELAEVTQSLLALDPATGDLFLLGVRAKQYERGAIVGHEGSWRAGLEGAQPGLFLPASFLLGSRYYVEYAPGRVMDRAENLAMHVTVDTPAGRFEGGVAVRESSELDDDEDEETIKIYGEGLGALVDGTLVLVDYGG